MAPRCLSLFFLLFLFSSHPCFALDSITLDLSISGGERLVSSGDIFVLGFFKPGKSPYYYVGIWYSLDSVSELTPVWVANRQTPIADHTKAEIKISDDGNLVLSNHSNPLIWSTNITAASSKSSVAVLLDTGNLVLRDGNVTLWQSFDHPTNTFLPGGKLGMNKVTGELQQLTSWTSDDDPAPGLFSFQIDSDGSSRFLISWNKSYNYWNSGNWNGKTFSLVPEMTHDYIYDYGFVSNAEENYFAYSVKNSSNLLSRFIMDLSGQIRKLTSVPRSDAWIVFWSQPRMPCQVYAHCGPFGSCNENQLPICSCIKGFSENTPSDWNASNWAGGCERNIPLQCSQMNGSEKVEGDQFYPIVKARLPSNGQSLQATSTAECESNCLDNCSCTAYSYGYGGGGCFVWHGGLLNLQDQYDGMDGGTVFIRLAASDDSSKEAAIVGATIGSVAALSALLVTVLWLVKRRTRRRELGKSHEVVDCGLISFGYSDLQRMTKNFSERLGGGGFGSVFKGLLLDSTPIAVKKLEGLKQGDKQFWSEVRTIGTTQHVNLVRLHGFCSEGKKRLLVYEYMPNGSLDSVLFHQNDAEQANRIVLDWKTRYQIALGIARGMTYLHEHCRDSIIHCDIKPENILLDASLVPKVADFGLAKLMGRDLSRVLTTMRGTIGYLAPEWISGLAITAKADVYSYGMMLFEIISGKRNLNMMEEEKASFFPALVASKLIEGDVIGLLDPQIVSDADPEEVTRLCKVACGCIQDHVNYRPTMSQVVQMLEGIIEVDTPPIPRILQILLNHSGSLDV